MPNSSTGGYLIETETDLNIEYFFHDLIFGITEIDRTLIRARWQMIAPTIPPSSTNWCAFSVSSLDDDDTAYIKGGEISANLIRHERYSLMCSFYGIDARLNLRKMRDGLEVGQNREVLYSNGFGYITCTTSTRAPELINDVWHDRYDIVFEFAREVIKSYNILNITTANVDIST